MGKFHIDAPGRQLNTQPGGRFTRETAALSSFAQQEKR